MDSRTEAILAIIGGLPHRQVTTNVRSPRGRFEHSFSGPVLLDYARAAGLVGRLEHGEAARHYFMVAAEDGFRVAVSMTEIALQRDSKRILLADQQNGEPLQSGVRLVVPGDDLGGRFVGGIVRIDVRRADAPDEVGATNGMLTLSGLLERPGSFSLEALATMPSTEVETETRLLEGGRQSTSFRGVLLFELLRSAGMVLDASINEDILSKVVVAGAADGHTAVLATGEIDPRFMNSPVIVATHRDGVPLTAAEGGPRLIVPQDRGRGRFIRGLRSLELRDGDTA